jgi:sec-independent protein translocase protein TatA
VVLVLVFGAAKIPQLGDALGKGIRNFKKASREDDSIDVTPRGEAQQQGHLSQGSSTTTPASKATEKKS